jgi:hypothetical protein
MNRRSNKTRESVNPLEEGARVRKKRKVRHYDLDGLAGVWSREEARQLGLTLAAARTADSELWR